MLKNRTRASKREVSACWQWGFKVAHLASHIANAHLIHQAQPGTIELSERLGISPVRVWQVSSPTAICTKVEPDDRLPA